VQKLSSVLELTVDCRGMTTSKMVKTVLHAAKCFLSGIHGRERLQMRCGSAVRKAGAAGIGAIENQMQKRTKHEMYRHQRYMEQVRLAGRMRRYIYKLRAYAYLRCGPVKDASGALVLMHRETV
jgi:hypothetical protein